MARARQTVERRQLGLALLRLRLAKGASQKEAAEAIGCARSRVGEAEDGTGTFAIDDLENLLDFYEVFGDERETMLALGKQARRRRRGRRAYVDVLPNGFERYADLEASASQIDVFESGVIPGLVQSSDYMRVLIEEGDGIWWADAEAGLEERIAFRADRQATILGPGDRRELRVVVTEESLQASFGLPDMMRKQMEYLLELMDGQPGLAVRMLRCDVRGNPLRGRSLSLFSFDDRAPAVGYSATVMGPYSYYDDEADVAVLKRAFERVWGLALAEGDSKRFIRKMLEG